MLSAICLQDTEEDEETRRASITRKQSNESTTEKKKSSLVEPPLRPSSINRNSAAEQNKTEEELKTEIDVDRTEKVKVESSSAIDQSSVTISIGEGGKSTAKSDEPSLISYHKLTPPGESHDIEFSDLCIYYFLQNFEKMQKIDFP